MGLNICITLLVLTLSFTAKSETLTFAYQDVDNHPYQTGNGVAVPADNPGVAVEQIRLMADMLNLELNLIRLPWKRGLQYLKEEKIEGLFNASFKEERLVYGRYPMNSDNKPDHTIRSYTNSYSLFQNKKRKLFLNDPSIAQEKYEIVVPLGFSIASDLRQKGMNVNETSEPYRYLELVGKQRADAVALLTPAGDAYLRQHPSVDSLVEKVTPPLSSKDYYLMLSHQFVERNSDLAQRIWKTIAEIRDSSQFQDWHRKYQQLPD